jgi:hypothetical protein
VFLATPLICYVSTVFVFSQGAVIHPDIWDVLLAWPLIGALFCFLPADLEVMTKRTGLVIFVSFLVTACYVMVQLRTYAIAVSISNAPAPVVSNAPSPVVVDMVRAAGFEATPRRIELATRFPCGPETLAVSLWFDRPLTTARTSGDLQLLRDLFEAANQNPIQCLSAYRKLTERFASADHSSPYALPAGTCESELALAETYVSTVFDDALRQQTVLALEIARNAKQDRQNELCRMSMADIRREYLEVIYGSTNAGGTAAPRPLWSLGADFPLTARRIRLASRFPCTLEGASAARWYDNGVYRTSAHLRAFNDLLGAAQQSPIRCLSAFRRVTEQFATADGRDPYMPAGVSCESELPIAEVYVSEVFDDPLRQKTIPTLDAARVAQQEGRMNQCRRGVGEIRRAYFDAIYGVH